MEAYLGLNKTVAGTKLLNAVLTTDTEEGRNDLDKIYEILSKHIREYGDLIKGNYRGIYFVSIRLGLDPTINPDPRLLELLE